MSHYNCRGEKMLNLNFTPISSFFIAESKTNSNFSHTIFMMDKGRCDFNATYVLHLSIFMNNEM